MSGFTGFIVGLVDHLGLLGVAVGVFLNGLSVPGTSEVMLPLSGVLVRQGRFALVPLFVVAMVAQLLGMLAAYALARYGGIGLVERYGRYILVSHRELAAGQRAFERYGGRIVIVGSCIPGIQGVMGYVAGLGQMDLRRFIPFLVVGRTIWIGGLIGLGYAAGGQLELIDRVIHQFGLVALLLFIGAGIWYVRRHGRRRRALSAPATGNSGDSIEDQAN